MDIPRQIRATKIEGSDPTWPNQCPPPLYPRMLRTTQSTGSSENLTPTSVTVEDDEIDNGGGGKGAGNLAKSNNSSNLLPPYLPQLTVVELMKRSRICLSPESQIII